MKNPMSLKKNKDFKRVYSKSKSEISPILVTYILKNKVGHIRVGVTTSKKIGKAVQRNRARRIIKQAFRNLDVSEQKSFDIVFVARKKTSEMKTQDIMLDMQKHLRSLRIL